MFIANPGVHKASGLKKLGDLLNIDLSEMIAFGDGANDFEMIEKVGLGVAMDNAIEGLKAKAKYHTDTVDNDGVYKFLIEKNII
jgi:hydroxymethylpyrimidine pyrophosphatase-like HAD family hydrolase